MLKRGEREQIQDDGKGVRKCRMFGEGRETIGHTKSECYKMKERESGRNELLHVDERGLEWMKQIKEKKQYGCEK